MKITNITTSNFLGARAVDLSLKKPVALIAGKNGAGKSSVRDAIALAFTDDLGRVSLKKDAGALVTEGAGDAYISVETADRAYYGAVIKSGKVVETRGCHESTQGGAVVPPAMPYVLDAQRFARMDDNERRAFLFGLMGVKMDGPAIKDRMLARGCDAAKVEQVMPILRAGPDAASKEAASKARDAKASWKTATGGETWGKDKAAKWQPSALPPDSEKASTRYENAVTKRKEADAELALAQQELGAAKAEQSRQQEAEGKRLELHTKASRAERIKAKLDIDTAELAAWEQKVSDCRARAGVAQPNPKNPGEYLLRGLATVTGEFLALSTEFPDVEWPSDLINRAAAHHAEYVKLHGEPIGNDAGPDPEAVAKLPEYENALELMRRSVENGKRDLAEAERAAEQLKDLDGIKATANVDALQQKVAELTGKRDAWRDDVEKYRDIADKHGRRASVMLKASVLHADVLAWTDIADALAPDGIPAELLAEALDPINERLLESAGYSEWEQPVIHSDMRITYGLRSYSLLSESEKWRTDAMIAEAVSHVSGLRLLVIDRFDVLDIKGRDDLLFWLDGMAADGEIDTALIFGTLKALPSLNFETIDAFWIENGTAGQLKEAA